VAYNIDIFDIQAEALPQDCLSTATNIERWATGRTKAIKQFSSPHELRITSRQPSTGHRKVQIALMIQVNSRSIKWNVSLTTRFRTFYSSSSSSKCSDVKYTFTHTHTHKTNRCTVKNGALKFYRNNTFKMDRVPSLSTPILREMLLSRWWLCREIFRVVMLCIILFYGATNS
jgi:hypothetical protein